MELPSGSGKGLKMCDRQFEGEFAVGVEAPEYDGCVLKVTSGAVEGENEVCREARGEFVAFGAVLFIEAGHGYRLPFKGCQGRG